MSTPEKGKKCEKTECPINIDGVCTGIKEVDKAPEEIKPVIAAMEKFRDEIPELAMAEVGVRKDGTYDIFMVFAVSKNDVADIAININDDDVKEILDGTSERFPAFVGEVKQQIAMIMLKDLNPNNATIH